MTTTAAPLVPGALTPEVIDIIMQAMDTKDLTLLNKLQLPDAVKVIVTGLAPMFKVLTIPQTQIDIGHNLLLSGNQTELFSAFNMDAATINLIEKLLESLPTNPPLANPAPTVSLKYHDSL